MKHEKSFKNGTNFKILKGHFEQFFWLLNIDVLSDYEIGHIRSKYNKIEPKQTKFGQKLSIFQSPQMVKSEQNYLKLNMR